MAKRYGLKPSEFLSSSPSEYQFDMLVCGVGLESERKAAEKARKEAQKRRVSRGS